MRRIWAVLAAALLAWGCAGIGGRWTAVPGMQQWRVRWGDGPGPAEKKKKGAPEEDAEEVAARRDSYFRNGWTCEGEGEHWLEVDWGRQAMVYGFSMRWDGDPPGEYGVQLSAKGKSWETVRETRGGNGGDYLVLTPQMARAARVVVKLGPGGKCKLAGMRVISNDTRPQMRINGEDSPSGVALLDGDSATAWSTEGPEDVEFVVDWGIPREMAAVQIDWAEGAARPSTVEVSASADGVQWASLGEGPPGETDPCDVWVTESPRRVRWIKISAKNGGTGFAVAGISQRGGSGDAARAWKAYETAAKEAAAARGPGGEGTMPGVFAGVPPRWTVAAGLDEKSAEALFSTEGAWSAGRGAPSLWPLVRTAAGTLSPRSAAKSAFGVASPGVPMPTAEWEWEGGLKLSARVMSAEGGGSWAEYTLENGGEETVEGALCWVLRPLRIPPPEAGGGVAPVTHVRSGTGNGADGKPWQEIRVNGAPLYAAPGERFAFAAAASRNGGPTGLAEGTAQGSKNVRDRDGLAGASWTWPCKLAPGESVRAVLASAPWPPRRGEKREWPAGAEERFGEVWNERAWKWRVAEEGYSPQIDRPERTDLARAQLSWVLGLHGEPETPDEALWRLEALLCAGRFGEARATVDQWLELARETLGVGDGEEDAKSRRMAADRERTTLSPEICGQFLFGVMETWRFAGDNAFLEAAYPVMRRIMLDVVALTEAMPEGPSTWRRVWRWLRPWRVKPPEVGPAFGLVADRAAGAGGVAVHQTAAQLWALLGWKELAQAAGRLGYADDAAWAESQCTSLREALRRSVSYATREETSPRIPASVESPDGPGGAAAAAVLFWPCGEGGTFPPAMVQNTLDGVYSRFLRWTAPATGPGAPESRGGTDGPGAYAWMSDVRYLTSLSRMGHADYARELLFDLCGRCDPPSWGALPAVVRARDVPGVATAWRPDAQTAALFFLAMRQIVVCEDGPRLHLLCGVPPEWVQHGQGLKVASAPTAWGALDLEASLGRRMFRVKVGGTASPPSGWRLWWPLGEPPERVMLDRVPLPADSWDALGIDLPAGFSGTLEAFFPEDIPGPREI